jgi:hypothetical protein
MSRVMPVSLAWWQLDQACECMALAVGRDAHGRNLNDVVAVGHQAVCLGVRNHVGRRHVSEPLRRGRRGFLAISDHRLGSAGVGRPRARRKAATMITITARRTNKPSMKSPAI